MAKDCIGCEFCFGCVGLRNKKYHIFNKEYSYEEYKKITEFWKKPENKSNLQKEFEKTNLQTPKQYATIVLSENCTGDSIHSSKNANDCYDVVGSENVKYCYDLRATNKESYDIASIGDGVEYSYETCSCGLGFSHGLFDVNCRTNVKNIYYCDTCVHGCSDCFGCVGLRGKQYYILNKQYNKEEYEKNVAKLIEYMQTT
ncbi:hypothetical protein KKG31_04785 [Patescibacteria group bacterium]|nr:hypothetical protein [Patescibacteria group bacterium]